MAKVARFLAFLALTGCYGAVDDMAQELDLRPVGLYTDPNPHGGTPKGALRVADNVVLRRDGILGPRPGFVPLDSPMTYVADPRYLLAYDGDVLAVGSSADASTQWASGDVEITADGVTALSWDTNRAYAKAAQSRGNLYITTQDAIRKLENSSDAVAATAGAAQPHVSTFIKITSGTPTTISQYGGRAYRATLKKTDGNGVVVTSAPSPAVIYQSTDAATIDVDVVVVLSPDAVAGDILQLWRTPEVVGTVSSLGVPGSEFFLAKEFELTATEITNQTYTFADRTPDDETGEALYTNPSREGILQRNDVPHVGKSIAVFRGSVFVGNTRGPHRLSVAGPPTADQTGNSTGVGIRTYTGTHSVGTNTITGMSSTVGLQVGQLVVLGAFTSDTRITGIAGTTVTVSNNATGSGSGSVSFYDSVRVKTGVLEDVYWPMTDTGLKNFIPAVNSGTGDIPASSYVRASSALRLTLGDGASFDRNDFRIEEILRNNDSFEVWATHGDEYEPALPLPTVANGTASAADIRPNGIQWSKTDQPEHVPEANFATVGTEAAILEMVATRDALFVFKEDGIWRLTGLGAVGGWRIDPVDRSTFILTPRCATVMAGRVWAWTNRGVVRVGDYGVESGDIVSKLAVGNQLRDLELGMNPTSTTGAWLAANEKDDELLVGVPGASGATVSTDIYVYNTKTQSWVTWDIAATYATTRTDEGVLWLGKASGGTSFERREGSVLLADAEYSITVNSVSGTELTIAGGSGWTPAVGDWLDGGARVTSVTSSTVFDTDTTNYPTGAATAYVAYESDIEFIAKTGGNPTALKQFSDAQVVWENLEQVRSFSLEFTSSQDDSPDVETRVMTRSTDPTQPRGEYFVVPSDHSITTQLWPRIRIKQAAAPWLLSGFGLTFRTFKTLSGYSSDPQTINLSE